MRLLPQDSVSLPGCLLLQECHTGGLTLACMRICGRFVNPNGLPSSSNQALRCGLIILTGHMREGAGVGWPRPGMIEAWADSEVEIHVT